MTFGNKKSAKVIQQSDLTKVHQRIDTPNGTLYFNLSRKMSFPLCLSRLQHNHLNHS